MTSILPRARVMFDALIGKNAKMGASAPAESKWKRWAQKFCRYLCDRNESPDGTKPVPLEHTPEVPLVAKMPPTANIPAGDAHACTTSSESTEAQDPIFMETDAKRMTQIIDEPSLTKALTSSCRASVISTDSRARTVSPDSTASPSRQPTNADQWDKAVARLQQESDNQKLLETMEGSAKDVDNLDSEPRQPTEDTKR